MEPATDLPQRVMAAVHVAGSIASHRLPFDVSVVDRALQLQGEVDSVAAKRAALRIADEFAGPEQLTVLDRLHVERTGPRPDGEMLDALGDALLDSKEFRTISLRRRHRSALEVLRTCPATDVLGEVEFAIHDGVVELDGIVPSLSHRRLAEVFAWWIGGCTYVANRLRVEPAERDGDDELAEAVALVLEVDPTLPESQPIGVAAEQGVVKLTGALRTEEQRQRAAQDAWLVEGVRDVRNEIAT